MIYIAFHRALVAFLLLAALTLIGCGGDVDTEDDGRPVEALYNEAFDLMVDGDYSLASTAFDEVDRQHPYSPWATKAQIMSSYAYYKSGQYDQALISAERFIQLHPGHKDTPYAYYLRAISYYEQITDVGRDQQTTRFALQALQEIIRRYPDSAYARDARFKIDLAQNQLAGKEMAVGRFYLMRHQYSAAINRFRLVIERYQTTSHAPEALHRLVEAYLSLGVVPEAQATAAVLGYNFPGSQWYLDSYTLLTGKNLTPQEDQESWISRTWKKIF